MGILRGERGCVSRFTFNQISSSIDELVQIWWVIRASGYREETARYRDAVSAYRKTHSPPPTEFHKLVYTNLIFCVTAVGGGCGGSPALVG